jgi:ribosomal-protein-alanine N-acetyltransferase
MAEEQQVTPMSFSFRPLRWADAWAIGGWRYAPPYDVYDLGRAQLLAAALLRRLPPPFGYEVFGVWAEGTLVGTFMFTRTAQNGISLGLALRPDLTGRGLGEAFVRAGLDFARKRYTPRFFRLDVAEFNQRAIKVYERAGFRLGGKTFQLNTKRGKQQHLEMRREA